MNGPDGLSGQTLARVFAALYGSGSGRLGFDARGVAVRLGVSAGTVRRWCVGASRERSAQIPMSRLELALGQCRPRDSVVRQQRLDRRNAAAALAGIDVRKPSTVLPKWHEKRWLEPHATVLVRYPLLGLAGVVVSRVSENDRLLRAAAGAGAVLGERAVFTNEFAARVVGLDVLDKCAGWRCVPMESVSGGSSRYRLWLDVVDVELSEVIAAAVMDEYAVAESGVVVSHSARSHGR